MISKRINIFLPENEKKVVRKLKKGGGEEWKGYKNTRNYKKKSLIIVGLLFM